MQTEWTVIKDPDGKEFFYHKPSSNSMWAPSIGNVTDSIEYIDDTKNHPLSNFYIEPFSLNNTHWNSVIHYLEAQSFQSLSASALVACLKTPREAFDFPRQYPRLVRDDWSTIKIQVMENGLLEKFSQNKDLKQLLMDTNGNHLSEHTDKDIFWGDNLNDTGQNWLGKLLMKLRDSFCIAEKITIKPLTGRINFYEKNKPFYQFTNFYSALVTVDNIIYPTSEHYFQGQKFAHLSISEFIRSLHTPEEVISFAHYQNFARLRDPLWNQNRNYHLMLALGEKLNQSAKAKNTLKETKNNFIIYKSKDKYWGVDNGIGENFLGLHWMSLRETLK